MALVKDYQNNEPNKTYLEKVALVESGGNPNAKAKTSSAVGQFQFVEGTWKDIVKRYKLGYTLEDRKDPVKSAKVMELYTQENEKALKPVLGRNLTDSEKYLGHFLGVAGAKSVFLASKKDPNMPVNYYISPKSLEANKSVFYNKDGSVKTTSQLLNWADDKMGVSINWENSVKPYMNVTSDVTNLQVPAQNTTFVPVPDVYKEKTAEKETETEQAKQQIAQSQSEEDFIQAYKRKEQPQVQEEQQQPIDVLNTFAQVSAFVDNPVAQEGRRVLDWRYLKDKPKYAVKDERADSTKPSDNTRTDSKPKVTDLKKVDVRNKTPKEILAERKATEEKGDKAILNQGLNILKPELWTRENWSDAASGIGEKFRFFPNDTDSFVDEYLNPFKMVGDMAESLGQAPLQAEQSDSYLPYVTAIGAPLTVGAIGGAGTKTTGEFVNNLANPFAGTGEIVNRLRNRFIPKTYIKNYTTNVFENSVPSYGFKEKTAQFLKGIPFVTPTNKIPIETIDNIIDQQMRYLDSEAYLQKRASNTGETISEIKKQIEKYKKDFEKTHIFLDDSATSNQGYYSKGIPFLMRPKIGVASGKNVTKEMIEGTLHHETNHALSPSNPKKYQNFPVLNVETGGKSQKYIDYQMLPEEQQVRLNKIKVFMEDNFGKKMGEDFTDDDIEKVLTFNKNTPNLNMSQKYKDAYDFINATRYVPQTGFDNYKDALKSALNTSWAITPIVGASFITTQETKQQGGVVKDNDGYLNPKNWGKKVIIESPSITMEGVKEPLIGYSPETGETKLMQPGQNYFFTGAKKVIETPLTKAEKEFLKELQNAKNR